MANDVKSFLTISLLIHAGTVALFSVSARRITVTMPVELSYFTPAAPAGQAAEQPVAAPPVQKAPPAEKTRKDEIAVPKKTAPKQKEVPAPVPAPQAAEQQRPGAAGEAAQSAGPAGSTGSPVSAEVSNFPYPYYLNSIKKKIDRTWQWTSEFGRLKAVVYFRIARDGSVADSSIKTSSGDSYFDQQALRSVQLASPFPPLPQGYQEDLLGIFFEFRTDIR